MRGEGAGVLTIGESLGLIRAIGAGTFAHVSDAHVGFGGAESNVAIALSRLGVPVTWLGRLGQDSLGELIVRELRAEGVSVLVHWDPTAPTALMLKESRVPGTTKVTYYRRHGAGSRLSLEDVPEESVAAASLLHVTGITPALSATASAAIDRAIDVAVASGVPVSFDFNYRSALWDGPTAGMAFARIARRASVVFAGADEAAAAVGPGRPEELAERLLTLGPHDVVIKLGEQGCYARSGQEEQWHEAVSIRPVDTVGAGDAFVAGYLAQYLHGATLSERLGLAVRTGAFACLVPGDWEGMPRRSELALLDGGEPVMR